MSQLTDEENAVLARLFWAADKNDSSGACIRRFLLAWWDSKRYGGLDITEAWMLSPQQRIDLGRAFGLALRSQGTLKTLIWRNAFERLAGYTALD